jgi:hypothetical protein
MGQVCNLPMRGKCLIHGRLQTCPTLPGLPAFRKVTIKADDSIGSHEIRRTLFYQIRPIAYRGVGGILPSKPHSFSFVISSCSYFRTLDDGLFWISWSVA